MFIYAYAVMASFFVIIWIALFILLPRSRQAILWTSLIFAPAGPISAFWHQQDYWHPLYVITFTVGSSHFGIEDYLIVFAVTGISSGMFEGLVLRRGFALLPPVSFRTLLQMTLWGVVGLSLMVLLTSVLHLNSIYAILLTILFAALVMLFKKWEVLLLALLIAVAFGFLYWLFLVGLFIPTFPRVIQALWDLKTTSGIMVAGVPIEEVLYAFTTALFAGPVFRVSSTQTPYA